MTTIRETQASGVSAGLAAFSSTTAANAAAWQEELRAAMQGSATTAINDDDRKTAIMGSLGSSAGSAVAAQTIGQTEEVSATEPSAKDQFLEFMEMTPMERMRAQILKSLGVTEEQLAAMSPEERKKIEDKIRQIIEETVKREAEKKTAENSQNAEDGSTAAPTAASEAATKTASDDAKTKTNAVGPTLEQILPFLRDDGGQPLGGKEAKLVAAAEKSEKEREEA
jgi:hypothetical protein